MEILRRIEGSGWYPIVNFRVRLEKAGARTDAQIADRMLDDLLAISAPADTRELMRAFLAAAPVPSYGAYSADDGHAAQKRNSAPAGRPQIARCVGHQRRHKRPADNQDYAWEV
jgi:hypothetical protein